MRPLGLLGSPRVPEWGSLYYRQSLCLMDGRDRA